MNNKKINPHSFTNWLASKNAVSLTLAVGILFLISNYQGIIYRANPENLEAFRYPYFLQVILSHIDSFFFGLATAIIIFQSEKEWHKITYCGFEGIMIFLNLNRDIFESLNVNAQFLLATYIALFSAFTLFYLGRLARQHLQSVQKNPENIALGLASRSAPKNSLSSVESILDNSSENGSYKASTNHLTSYQIGFGYTKKPKTRGPSYDYERIKDLNEKGLSTKEIAGVLGCSESTIRRAKKIN